MEYRTQFVQLIEWPVANLLTASRHYWPNDEMALYSEVIVSFLQNDLDHLGKLNDLVHDLQKFDDLQLSSEMRLATQLRHLTGVGKLQVGDLIAAQQQLQSCSIDNGWRGELAYIIARGYEVLGDRRKGNQFYLLAEKFLSDFGAHHKALKAQFNAIICENNYVFCNPEHFAQKYQRSYQSALEFGDNIIAGSALHNLSRVHQLAGALDIALEHSNRALELLEEDYGTLFYQLVLAQRCSVLIDLGRLRAAQVDDAELALSTFSDVIEARKVIHVKAGLASENSIAFNRLSDTWKERWLECRSREVPAALAETEQKLVDLLVSGYTRKVDLLGKLYGKKVSHETCRYRFNDLLRRLEAKRPGLLVNNGDMLLLSPKITFVKDVS